jgi:glutaconyl-CoA/methylmalonyl-CoA decarboxylase subunit gamma
MKKLRVTVDGKAYDVIVEILDEGGASAPAHPAVQPALVEPAHVSAPPVGATAASGAAAPGDVPSPLAGKVVSIDVKPGQEVAAGAQLLTLEAMKMNTYVFAPAAGTVKEILVAPGDAVAEGQVLVRLS